MTRCQNSPPQSDLLAAQCLAERRVETRVERPLAQQPRAERVDGAEEGLVDLAQRRVQPRRSCRRPVHSAARSSALERRLEPLPQLRRRLARERDGRDLVDRAVPERTSATMRRTISVVLPAPAPASTSRFTARSSVMRSRAAWSGRRGLAAAPGASAEQRELLHPQPRSRRSRSAAAPSASRDHSASGDVTRLHASVLTRQTPA
jgi:hypothetical protein